MKNSIDEAIKFIKQKDVDHGVGWSDDTLEIAVAMVEYTQCLLDSINDIIEKNTKNRRYWKKWEEEVMEIIKSQYDMEN